MAASLKPKTLILLFGALTLLLLTSCSHAPGKLVVTVLDVGQGDSIVVQTPSGKVMVVDGGGSNDEKVAGQSMTGERVVVPFLHYEGIHHVDLVVLTHPHGDHVGGLPTVLREETVGMVLDGTRLVYPSAAYKEFREVIRDKHIPYGAAVRGMKINFGDGVTADVLNPPAVGYPYGVTLDDKSVNNYSVVMRLTYGRTHVLLDGDAEVEAEESMMAAYPDVSADVLKCGHHGSNNASCDEWLSRVHPNYAAISCGLHNMFGHPHRQTLARLTAHHVQIFRTDHDGALTFVSDGNSFTASKFLAVARE